MAAHVHTQIRTAAAAALTGLATTGARVFANRLGGLGTPDLPALRISLDEEVIDVVDIHAPITYQRIATLVVECCALASAAVDDTCDQMGKEVEIALAAGLTVAGRKLETVLTACRYDDEATGLDAAVKRLEFKIECFTRANTPDVLT